MNSVIASIKTTFDKNPLPLIVLLAFLVRLIAVIFAQGYMMHDDHFLTIEPAGSWADGKNFNQWLPGFGNSNPHPEPISFFYPGILAGIFSLLQFIGIDNPEIQMYFIRLIHAGYSLLVVVYGFKITALLSTRMNAITAGLLLALIGIMPNFSVRNLVEMVCMPPLLIGFYLMIKNIPFRDFTLGKFFIQKPAPTAEHQSSKPLLWLTISAVLMGMAVGIRFQTGLLVALTGLVLWLQHSFRYAFIFGTVSFTTFFLTQIDDVLLWGGQPFQHLQGYFEYNKKNANNYPGSPLAYLSFIAVFILPPVSLFLVAGFVKSWKKYFLLFLPVAGFLLFHILYPNRQERFILPALPFIVILGVIGWNSLMTDSRWLNNKKGLVSAGWKFFWVVNTMVMLIFSVTYTKKSGVEAMSYLYEQGDCRNFALEFTHSDRGAMVPQFYSNEWTTYYYWKKGDIPANYILNMPHDEERTAADIQPRRTPNYFLFYDDDQLEKRVAAISEYFPSLTYCASFESGWFDKLLHWINPKNSLEKIHIYKAPKGQEKFSAQ